MPRFLKQGKGENNYGSHSCPIHLHKSYGAKLGFEHTTPGSAVNCAIDCPVKLGQHIE